MRPRRRRNRRRRSPPSLPGADRRATPARRRACAGCVPPAGWLAASSGSRRSRSPRRRPGNACCRQVRSHRRLAPVRPLVGPGAKSRLPPRDRFPQPVQGLSRRGRRTRNPSTAAVGRKGGGFLRRSARSGLRNPARAALAPLASRPATRRRSRPPSCDFLRFGLDVDHPVRDRDRVGLHRTLRRQPAR